MSASKKFALALLAAISLGSLAHAYPQLWAPDFCMSANIQCEAPSNFIYDQDGRCGCLVKADYLPASLCQVMHVVCNEQSGYTLSSLQFNGEYIGCGCYQTHKPN